MEEKKEYLTEENYERGKKKIKTIALIILVLGLLIGGSLIATGIIKSSQVETTVLDTKEKEDKQAEIDSLNSELATLKAKETKEFTSNGFSEEYFRLEKEILTKLGKVQNLQTEIGRASTDNSFSKAKYTPFYMFGAFAIIASCMISGIIYLSTKQREIIAYQTQQVMPIAQEGIEKVAPTIGKAGAKIAKEMTPVYKDIAKEISKGIKEGLKDEEKK